MAVSALDATIGGASANTYVTLAEADQFFDDRLNASDWTGASAEDKTRALFMAKDRLEQEVFDGFQNDLDQALAWPRAGAHDVHGDPYEVTEIPQSVKDSQCELALVYLQKDFNADSGLEAFSEVAVGSIEVIPRHLRLAGELPAHVARELAHVLMTPATSNIRVVRG